MTDAKFLTYQIAELPDPQYARYRTVAGGNAATAIYGDFEHLWRAFASLDADTASAEIRFVYTLVERTEDAQSRLQLYFHMRASDARIVEVLEALLIRGPLSRFYDFQRADPAPIPWGRMRFACDVIRRAEHVASLHGPDKNVNIPPFYSSTQSLVPSRNNNYQLLDRVLGNIDEPAVISLCVAPTDVSAELHEHTRYLAKLQSINRGWSADDERNLPKLDYSGGNRGWRLVERTVVEPLRTKDPAADEQFRAALRFHETLHLEHLAFHVRVLAPSEAVAQVLGSVVAECAFEEGTYRLITTPGDDPGLKKLLSGRKAGSLTIPIPCENSDHAVAGHTYSGLARLTHVAPVAELSGVFRLPVASFASPCCIRKNTDPPSVSTGELIVLGHDQEPSSGLNGRGPRGLPRGIRVSDLRKHVSIFGTPGVGKTTANINKLTQLARRGIHFMVLETAKKEYRTLKKFKKHRRAEVRQLAKLLRVYTAGAESPSPLRLNPLEIPQGICRDEHVGHLFECFKGSMPMEGPLMALIAKALARVYDEFPDPNTPPVMADLVRISQMVMEEAGYSGETDANLCAALVVRLEMLTNGIIGRVFQCRHSVPTIEQLLESFSIIELDDLPGEQKALLVLFILTAIREHVKAAPKSDRDVRFVIVIEEAHNVVGRNTEARTSAEVNDPKAHAAAYVSQMLADLRASGIGIIIVDQLPLKVADDVVKNTLPKLTFREVASGPFRMKLRVFW